ncbi:MAG: hypothetical protein ACXV3D_05280 [Halobacteriota archaeon]
MIACVAALAETLGLTAVFVVELKHPDTANVAMTITITAAVSSFITYLAL